MNWQRTRSDPAIPGLRHEQNRGHRLGLLTSAAGASQCFCVAALSPLLCEIRWRWSPAEEASPFAWLLDGHTLVCEVWGSVVWDVEIASCQTPSQRKFLSGRALSGCGKSHSAQQKLRRACFSGPGTACHLLRWKNLFVGLLVGSYSVALEVACGSAESPAQARVGVFHQQILDWHLFQTQTALFTHAFLLPVPSTKCKTQIEQTHPLKPEKIDSPRLKGPHLLELSLNSGLSR